MLIQAGTTANFVVSYDNMLGNGLALAQAVLQNCENDLVRLSVLFGGIMPAPASLPFQVR